MADYIRQTWAKGSNIANLRAFRINGLEAASATTRGNINGRTSDIRLVAYRGGGNETFRLMFVSQPGDTRRLQRAFDFTQNSFRQMSAAELRNLQPWRIRLYRVRRGDTVSSIAQREMAMRRFALERFMLLNGMSDETGLQAGRVVKVVKDR